MSCEVRCVAIIAAYNEERYIVQCLEHLRAHGVDAYLIDNGSTDDTASLASSFLGQGLIAIEHHPRDGLYRWQAILERKEDVAAELEADWVMHLDPDELRLPPRSGMTLVDAFREAAESGYNAVDFLEYTFVPTLEQPDHDHPNFVETMRWYYPYKTDSSRRVTAWRRSPRAAKPWRRPGTGRMSRLLRRPAAELAWSGGHRVRFPGLRVSPKPFKMRHYQFLSVGHAVEKYVERVFLQNEADRAWHGWRARLQEDEIKLPSCHDLRVYESDDALDPSRPRHEHCIVTG